ncbi:MAG: hypothetical protein WBA91_07575 [Paracoccaceae bacterium]
MALNNPRLLALIFLALVLALGGMPFLMGGLYLDKHEGDTIHMADMILRMAQGEVPHLDFMTPIGIAATAPIALFSHLGLGLGHAFFAGQMLVGLMLLPAVLWVVHTRINDRAPALVGAVYGGYVLTLCVALIHGEAFATISASMYYNRWAWALAYLIVPLVLMAPGPKSCTRVDGVIIGLAMSALALSKMTYFLAFFPAILLALLVRRDWRRMGIAAATGLAVVLLITALFGTTYWIAYLHDLAVVANSDLRPKPGGDFSSIMAGPAYFGGTLALLATVIFLRQSGRMVEGLVLLVLMPGLVYVVYQNFGNDAQWLMLLAMLAFVLRAEAGQTNGFGWHLRQAMTYAAVVAFALGFASASNLLISPFRHFVADKEKNSPLLPGSPGNQDIYTLTKRMYDPRQSVPLVREGGLLAEIRATAMPEDNQSDEADADEEDEAGNGVTLNGEALAECEIQSGIAVLFELVTRDLERSGYAGSSLIAADILSPYWLFGDFKPAKGGAPWYYGDLSGIKNADYLVVPICPLSAKYRKSFIELAEKRGYRLQEVRRTEDYILLTATLPQ